MLKALDRDFFMIIANSNFPFIKTKFDRLQVAFPPLNFSNVSVCSNIEMLFTSSTHINQEENEMNEKEQKKRKSP